MNPKLAMLFADAAYCDEKVRPQAWSLQDGWQGYSVGSDAVFFKASVAAFRGSDDLLDWESNFRIGKAKNGCHTGFWKAFLALKPRIRIWADKFDHIKIVGHSRGAAIGTVAGKYLADNGYKVDVISFGAPPLGDSDFCYNYKPFLRRFTCGRDIVPRLDMKIADYIHPKGEFTKHISLKPPKWTWWFPGAWGVLHHRRWAYYHGVSKY